MHRLTLLIISYLSYRAISSCVLLSLISQNFVSKYLHGKLIGAPDNEDAKAETMAGLKASAGFVRRELGQRIRLRRTPEVVFLEDSSLPSHLYIVALPILNRAAALVMLPPFST